MILAIDGVGAKHSGAATVLRSVVEAALRSEEAGQILVFCSPRALRNFDLPRSDRLTEIEVPKGETGPVGRLRWQLRGLSAAVESRDADALLCLSGGGSAPRGIPSATFIQQSLPFSPEALAVMSWADRARTKAIGWSMRLSCRRAGLVLVQTATMKRCVQEAFRLQPERVEVVEPEAEVPRAAPPAPVLSAMRAVSPDRRLLYVGNTSLYKNLVLLPPAVRQLRRQVPGATLFATVPAGHPITREEGILPLAHLGPGALREAYELATVLVMPSLVETVGLPLLEAAALGTPVVAADRPYAHDVCGDAALYFDPHDPGALAGLLARLLADPGLRASLAAKGRASAELRAAARPYDRMIELVVRLAARAAG